MFNTKGAASQMFFCESFKEVFVPSRRVIHRALERAAEDTV